MKLYAGKPIGVDSIWYQFVGTSGKVLLDFDIDRNGRRIDYLRLDAFWGWCPRPFACEPVQLHQTTFALPSPK
jgi:hypothetical protein